MNAQGETTRLADKYIQDLYNNPNNPVVIIDHQNTQQSNVHLTQIILKRLISEHLRDRFRLVTPNSIVYVK